MEAWKTTLGVMEKMITGVSHSIPDGAVILGLASWHLYPDMYVLTAGQNRINMQDPLFRHGGVITLGISSDNHDGDGGVSWSLPLSYLRYYGDPVMSTRTVGESSSRLTFQEVFVVVLGCVLSSWGKYGQDIRKSAQFILNLEEVVVKGRSEKGPYRRTWLNYLAEAAEAYLSASGIEQQHLHSLICRGRRRYRNFLAQPDHHRGAFFDMNNINTFLLLIPEMEAKISALRHIAQRLSASDPESLIIRYRVSRKPHFLDFVNDHLESVWEFATTLRSGPDRRKRKRDPSGDRSGHIRWILLDGESPYTAANGEQYHDLEKFFYVDKGRQSFQLYQMDTDSPNNEGTFEYLLGDINVAAIFKKPFGLAGGSETIDIEIFTTALERGWIESSQLCLYLDTYGRPEYLRSLRALAASGEVYKLMPNATISTSLFGEPLRNALWIPERHDYTWPSQNATKIADDHDEPILPLLFGTGIDSRLVLFEPLDQQTGQKDQKANIGLVNSEIMEVDSQPTAREHQKDHSEPGTSPLDLDDDSTSANEKRRVYTDLVTYQLNRAQTFACIAMFENRNVNLDPRTLSAVFAISAANSIYVAMPLISDPSASPSANEVKHIIGNIGKPGLRLMIPPIKPTMKKIDENKWVPVPHLDFNGRLEDSFQHTSMHLSFSKYRLPVIAALNGEQAIQANFLETLVSIFDRAEWVADLDVLGASRRPQFKRLEMEECCDVGHHTRNSKRKGVSNLHMSLTSIDSWNEFLDRPQNPSIFRASGNWLARLSAATLSTQQGFETVILPDNSSFCWICVERYCKKLRLSIYGEDENAPMFIC